MRPPLIEGHIESVTEHGVICGWLRHSAWKAPSHVQVLHRDRIVAEAVARDFRRDLLMSGHGHGHYGFLARLRTALPPGPCRVVLHLPLVGVDAPMAVHVPNLAPARAATIEDLLRAAERWTTADLQLRPYCLDMARQHAAQGTPRFVDSAFRLMLERWPSPAEARSYAAALDAGRIGPQAVLEELLTSRERADMAPELASPYDPEFPFSAIEG